MKVKHICHFLEEIAPPSLAESYDNAGLMIGDPEMEITGVLINLDITEKVVEEAINKGINMIVAHHPIWFMPRKRLNGEDYISRTIISAIKNNIALYACHTNLDNVHTGVNKKICQKLGLENLKVLSPKSGTVLSLVTYVPHNQAEKVKEALFSAGAGAIGNYSECSFTMPGTGSFLPGTEANPYTGERGTRSEEDEMRIHVILPAHRKGAVLSTLKNTHPYEEVAYQLYPTENVNQDIGSGMIGNFTNAMSKDEFLSFVRDTFDCGGIRYADAPLDQIKTVAVCGGSGSFLIHKAVRKGADAFITGDITYHKFFDNEDKMLLLDIGHYESEQFTSEIFYEKITNKFTNFAVRLSEVKTNPVKYYK